MNEDKTQPRLQLCQNQGKVYVCKNAEQISKFMETPSRWAPDEMCYLGLT
jgi:hypothetical protein